MGSFTGGWKYLRIVKIVVNLPVQVNHYFQYKTNYGSKACSRQVG